MPPDTALRAYRNFFSSFNTRDPHEFSMALHYPHVRITWRSQPRVIADAEAHALNLTWQPFIDQGWDHTNGHEPQVVHTSTDKWHIAGGWTRVRSDDSPILTNHVTYIVTRIDDYWGIQCRYGIDPEPNSKAADTDVPLRVVDSFRRAIGRRTLDDAWNACGPTVYAIDVGSVRKVTSAEELPLREITGGNVELVQSGLHSATFAVTGNLNSALLYLTDENGWRIRAVSWI